MGPANSFTVVGVVLPEFLDFEQESISIVTTVAKKRDRCRIGYSDFGIQQKFKKKIFSFASNVATSPILPIQTAANLSFATLFAIFAHLNAE
jgi:hypothetical protein